MIPYDHCVIELTFVTGLTVECPQKALIDVKQTKYLIVTEEN